MNDLGFQSSRADPDVWFRLAKRGEEEYYEYVLLYTDDCLVISDQAESILRNEIGNASSSRKNQLAPQNNTWGVNFDRLPWKPGLRHGHSALRSTFRLPLRTSKSI